MASLIDSNERKLIPAWKNLNSSLHELRPLRSSELTKGNIDSYIFEWKNNCNIGNAADLLTAAIINNRTNEEPVKEAAIYILNSGIDVKLPVMASAQKIAEINSIEPMTTAQNIHLYSQIANHKQFLIKHPQDAIAHILIARCYLLLGQIDKAEIHVRIALYIDHNNRYVVRCASRFFIHVGHPDEALHILRASSLSKIDPWLMASEISVSQLLDKSSPNLKRSHKLLDSHNFSLFDETELSATLATQELLCGSYNKSRKLFNHSLLCPNSNSLAQAKWMVNKEKLVLDFQNVDMLSGQFLEAKSYNEFTAENYQSAFDFAKQWLRIEPYSTRTILYSYGIAVNQLKNYQEAQRIMSDAIQTHRNNPTFINNYAYALALDGKINEADALLSTIKLKQNPTQAADICLMATHGLIELRKGNFKEGFEAYKIAILQSKEVNDAFLNHSAILNYCREVLMISTDKETKEYVSSLLNKIPDLDNNKDLIHLKKDIDILLKEDTAKTNSITFDPFCYKLQDNNLSI